MPARWGAWTQEAILSWTLSIFLPCHSLHRDFCPYEIKITPSIHAPCLQSKWEEDKVKCMGHLSSILLGQKNNPFAESPLRRLLLTCHWLELVHMAMPGWGGDHLNGHITAPNTKEQGKKGVTLQRLRSSRWYWDISPLLKNSSYRAKRFRELRMWHSRPRFNNPLNAPPISIIELINAHGSFLE